MTQQDNSGVSAGQAGGRPHGLFVREWQMRRMLPAFDAGSEKGVPEMSVRQRLREARRGQQQINLSIFNEDDEFFGPQLLRQIASRFPSTLRRSQGSDQSESMHMLALALSGE